MLCLFAIVMHLCDMHKSYRYKGTNFTSSREKNEDFSPISADWFIRRIIKALKYDIYLAFIIATLV